MNLNYQLRMGFLNRSAVAEYVPDKQRFKGIFGPYLNKILSMYDSTNLTVVLFDDPSFGDCDSGNCTHIIGAIQRGEIDLSEAPFTFTTNAESITGIKPGAVLGETACCIGSILPSVGIVREDVIKSLSIFSLDSAILLAVLLLFLFSFPFILWYFRLKLFNVKTNSPPIIWPMICEILGQGSVSVALFHRGALRFIWLSIAFTLFFMTALYSSSFTTDLSSKAPTETIDSLEDVASCSRIPIWMEMPLCKIMVNRGKPQVAQDILKRGSYMRSGQFITDVLLEEKDVKQYVFIVTRSELDSLRISQCALSSNPSMAPWYRSPKSFPAYVTLTVLNANQSPELNRFLIQLQEKLFHSGIWGHFLNADWTKYLLKLLDPKQKSGCLQKTSIRFISDTYRFNQLNIANYKIFFHRFLYMIPICMLILIGEHLNFCLIVSK